MDRQAGVLEIGLRVLAAINASTNPDPYDVAILRLVAPQFAHLPADELACAVVAQDLRERSKTAGHH